VIHAAGVVGMKAAFASLNAVLSKFAHPTALVVLSFPQGQALDNFCNSFLPIGASFSLNACAVITAFVQGLVPSDPGS
jgi:hypothetical protein